ncbi:MAG: hypothetical protein Fur0039_05360 [Rhodocyclaceae bacterium]
MVGEIFAPMEETTELARFRCPLGGQEVVLSEVRYAAGGMPLLRLRLRERSRFTILDIDAVSAAKWGEAMLAWARAQPAGDGPG